MQVAFYKGRGRVGNRVIAWWLAGPYSHVELVLGHDPAGRAICASSSMMDGGVRVKHMDLNHNHWDLVEVPGDQAAAWKWLSDHTGAGYDWLGAAGFVARVLGHDAGRFSCSEAVGAMLGIEQPWRLDPCSLYVALTWRVQPAAV